MTLEALAMLFIAFGLLATWGWTRERLLRTRLEQKVQLQQKTMMLMPRLFSERKARAINAKPPQQERGYREDALDPDRADRQREDELRRARQMYAEAERRIARCDEFEDAVKLLVNEIEHGQCPCGACGDARLAIRRYRDARMEDQIVGALLHEEEE